MSERLDSIARHVSTAVTAVAICVSCIVSAEGLGSRISGSQIELKVIKNEHVADDAAIAASKLDASLATQSWVTSHGAANPTGMIIMTGGATPAGYVLCDGASYDGTQSAYSALWAVIGTTYGGTGQSSFKVPDLRGRSPFGAGTGTGLSARSLGDKGGEERHTLTISEMPAHTHGIQFWGTSGGNYGLVDSINTGSSGYSNTQSTGGGNPHNTMPPFVVVRFCIKL